MDLRYKIKFSFDCVHTYIFFKTSKLTVNYPYNQHIFIKESLFDCFGWTFAVTGVVGAWLLSQIFDYNFVWEINQLFNILLREVAKKTEMQDGREREKNMIFF